MTSSSVTQDVAEQIRDVVAHVPGVAGLSGGRMGEAFLRFPGAMIEGLRLVDDARLAVYVLYNLRSRRAIPQMVEDIRTAVAGVPGAAAANGTRVDVVVVDAV